MVYWIIQHCCSFLFVYGGTFQLYDSHDVIKWRHFPRYWPFERGIHRSEVNSPHKGQYRGALMFSLICAWTNHWLNNRDAGDLRRHLVHWDVIVMRILCVIMWILVPCDIVHWSAAARHSLQDCFGVFAVLVLSVILCSFLFFLGRILFHHDFHHDSCDYCWDFIVILFILNYTFWLPVTE